jgi:hypothetical protein
VAGGPGRAACGLGRVEGGPGRVAGGLGLVEGGLGRVADGPGQEAIDAPDQTGATYPEKFLCKQTNKNIKPLDLAYCIPVKQ